MKTGKILAIFIILALVASVLSISRTSLEETPEKKSAEVLIQNAERLREHIDYRLSLINNILNDTLLNITEINQTLEEIVALVEEGDTYLNTSRQLFEEGNYTGAKYYAIKAIQCYGKALKLLSYLFKQLGEQGIEYMEKYKEKIMNRTRTGLHNHTLIVAFQRAKEHIDRLLRALENITIDDPELKSNITYLIDTAEELLNEGLAQLESGNVSAAARLLARARKYIGLATAQLHKAGLITRMEKLINKGVWNETIRELIKELKEDLTHKNLGQIIKELKHIEKEAKKPKPPVPPGPKGKGQGKGSSGCDSCKGQGKDKKGEE